MAEEYISRRDAISWFRAFAHMGEDNIPTETVLDDLTFAIPAADVEPVRHGRWEPGNQICPVCGEDKFKDLYADIWSDWSPAYCPNCGAKMELEVQTDDD